MKDLTARWVFSVGILYLLPEARRSKWSCKKWVGSNNIVGAFCSVLDLYNCSRLVSGVQHITILQEMVYRFSLFLTEISPPANKIERHNTFFTNASWNTNKTFLFMCKALSFLRKYNLCWPFLYKLIASSSHLSLSSIVVPRYL